MIEPIFEHKYAHKGYIIDIKIYRVPKDKFFPEGVKYSLVLIKNGKRVVGYDNHERKGDHMHKGNREFRYEYIDEWKLIADFNGSVEKITKGELN